LNIGGGLGHELGPIGDDDTPADVGDVRIGERVLTVSGNQHVACAVADNNSVTCWGYRATGWAMGQWGSFPGPIGAWGPIEVGAPVTDVEVFGDNTICAITQAEELVCWGTVDFILGYQSGEFLGDDEKPSDLGPLQVGGRVVQVDGSRLHICVLLEGGAVRCWGEPANFGLPGSSDTWGDDEPPEETPLLDFGGEVATIGCGTSHTCVVRTDGAVRCVGSNHDWEAGVSNASNGIDTDEAVDLPLPGPASDVAGGDDYTCALLTDGAVYCWGDLRSGPEWDGVAEWMPPNLPPVDLGGAAVQISAASRHACAVLETGRVRCWGQNSDGRLGYGNTEPWVGDDEHPAAAGDVPVF
jgi:alpha-tubulin suppressor-like RCC1 family protein